MHSACGVGWPDPTFGRPECSAQAPPPELPALPVRIWAARTRDGQRVFLRRGFEVQPGLRRAKLYATCDDGFVAYLDGVEVSRSPERAGAWRRMVRTDLTNRLGAGRHVLAFEGINHKGPACLLACLDLEYADGRIERVGTDTSWLASEQASAGWNQPGPDPDWPRAVRIAGVSSEPYGYPGDAPLDFYRGDVGVLRALPVPVAKVLRVDPGAGVIRHVDRAVGGGLGHATIRVPGGGPRHLPQVDLSKGWPFQHLRREHENGAYQAWLREVRAGRPSITVDFGIELHGRVRIVARPGTRAIAAVVTGESPGELDNYERAYCQPLELGPEAPAVTELTGFRYARIFFLWADGPVEVDSIDAELVYYPVEYRGQFACSDPLLTRIWYVGAYTVHLCMQNEVWDGVKRDQMPWMGDAHVEHLAIYAAFGEYALARRTLRVLRELGPPGGHINGIASYSMWWVIGLRDYWLHSGDAAFLRRMHEPLVAMLRFLENDLDDEGCYAKRNPGGTFVDWSTLSPAQELAGTHWILCRALADGAAILADLGDVEQANRYERLADRARRAGVRRWCRREEGWFGRARQLNALAILAGACEQQDVWRIVEDELLAEEHAPPATPWHRYYILEALAAGEAHGQALDAIRRYWGKMIQIGATTFWESFDLAWTGPDYHRQATTFASYGGYRISLCHGWSAGPTVWLNRHVLGVQPTGPGFAACRIAPVLCDLNWAQGRVPTPFGPIEVAWSRAGQDVQLCVTVPAGVRAAVDVPARPGAEIVIRRGAGGGLWRAPHSVGANDSRYRCDVTGPDKVMFAVSAPEPRRAGPAAG